MTKLARPMGDYLRENVHYTFGGFNFPATFLDLLLEVGADRIMFSVDYPYGSMTEARAFLEQLPVSCRRQGAHRARQCGAAFRPVERIPFELTRTLSPFVPAQAGTQAQCIQHLWRWVPACAGTNGESCGSIGKAATALGGRMGRRLAT